MKRVDQGACFGALLAVGVSLTALSALGQSVTGKSAPGQSEAGQSVTGQSGAKVADLAWLAGAWTASVEGAVAERTCTQPAGGSMTCMMRIVAGNQVVWLEFSVLRDTPGGMLLDTRFFTGDLQPADPISTELHLRTLTASEAVFDNPSGTQPKSESVTLTGPGAMKSHADLVDSKGKASTMDVVWAKAH